MLEMNRNQIDIFLNESRIGRLAMADEKGCPYIIPLPFCWLDGALYLRLSLTGRKGGVLRANSKVCFEVDAYADDLSEYASVLIEGTLKPVESLEEKSNVRVANDDKYTRLRNGFRPGHGRSTPLEILPLQKIEVSQISGRKKEPAVVVSAPMQAACG